MGRKERDVEQRSGVDGLIDVHRHEAPPHFDAALVHDRLANVDRHAPRLPHFGLHLHDAVELGERHALGVMGVDGVDVAALFAQAVGEQHLTDVHVDAGDDRRDLGVALADVDAGVDVRVGQLFAVEDVLEVVGKLLEAARGHGERTRDALAAAGIGFDPHADRRLVHLS